MKTLHFALWLALATQVIAANPTLESRITSAALFKNGLAVIHREVTVPEAGTYTIIDLPEPIHGTLWIESGAKVVARATTVEMSAPLDALAATPNQETLAGKQVTLHFVDGDVPPLTGRVSPLAAPRGSDAWNRAYSQTRSPWSNSSSLQPTPPRQTSLVLETANGRAYVDFSRVSMIEERAGQETVTRQRPVLELEASEPTIVTIVYLAKGLSWSPSYRVDVTDAKELQIEQKAVIKNELGDLTDIPLYLISGYPSIQFSHVTSPFSLRTSWQQFFTELNAVPRPGRQGMAQVRQQAATLNVISSAGPDLSAVPAGEGVDLHYEPIGAHSLREGDALMMTVAAGETPYTRIVDWVIPDTRTADGRFVQDYERQQDPEKYEDAAWDALRFQNPLPFPMTTAPAMVVSGGQFNGQRLSTWVNQGEETILQVTQALSLRTHHVEYEEEGERELVRVGGYDFRRVTVKGLVRANNHRDESINLVVQRKFSGDLLEADGNPTSELLEEGAYSVNKRNRLIWEVPVGPGQEIAYAYRYQVLVRH